jgi:hypothetical protein
MPNICIPVRFNVWSTIGYLCGLILLITGCAEKNVEPVQAVYQSDVARFMLLAIDPSLASTLGPNDTIRATIAYNLVSGLETSDSLFDFSMVYKPDSVVDPDPMPFLYHCADRACNATSRKWFDTLTILCPVDALLDRGIQLKPLVFNFQFTTGRECDEPEHYPICFSMATLADDFSYSAGVDTSRG